MIGANRDLLAPAALDKAIFTFEATLAESEVSCKQHALPVILSHCAHAHDSSLDRRPLWHCNRQLRRAVRWIAPHWSSSCLARPIE
jgi:hypothetical protein